jgi:hypothetical protein
VLYIAVGPQFRRLAVEWRYVGGCWSQLNGDRGLQGALQRYRYREGTYPPSLEDLYPDFVTRHSVFHCPADPSPASNISYRYRRPFPAAPADTIILTCEHHSLPGVRIRLLLPIEGGIRQEQERVAVAGER